MRTKIDLDPALALRDAIKFFEIKEWEWDEYMDLRLSHIVAAIGRREIQKRNCRKFVVSVIKSTSETLRIRVTLFMWPHDNGPWIKVYEDISARESVS